MAWRALTEADVLKEACNPSEQAQIAAEAASGSLAAIVTSAILEARSMVEGAGVSVDPDTTKLPDSLRPHVIAVSVWRWVCCLPNLKALQTEGRKEAAERTAEVYGLVTSEEFIIEEGVEPDDDAADPSGDWNSDVAVVLRTGTARAN